MSQSTLGKWVLAALVTGWAAGWLGAAAWAQDGGQITVTEGRTLWAIAQEVRPQGASINDTIATLRNMNPEAFQAGDPNALMVGAVLRIPTLADIREHTGQGASSGAGDDDGGWMPPTLPRLEGEEDQLSLSRRIERLRYELARAQTDIAKLTGERDQALKAQSELRVDIDNARQELAVAIAERDRYRNELMAASGGAAASGRDAAAAGGDEDDSFSFTTLLIWIVGLAVIGAGAFLAIRGRRRKEMGMMGRFDDDLEIDIEKDATPAAATATTATATPAATDPVPTPRPSTASVPESAERPPQPTPSEPVTPPTPKPIPPAAPPMSAASTGLGAATSAPAASTPESASEPESSDSGLAQPTFAWAGKASEESAGESADEPANEPANEPADARVDEPADEPADERADEPANERADEPTDEPADEPEAPEQPSAAASVSEQAERPSDAPRVDVAITPEPTPAPAAAPTPEPTPAPAAAPTPQPTPPPAAQPAPPPPAQPAPAAASSAMNPMQKMDMARAYIQSGDKDSARALLNQVASEGTPIQQAEARGLLASL